MHDPFDRRISFCAVALVFGRLRNTGKVWVKIVEHLDSLIRNNDLFKGAPFLWVGPIFRYGIKNDLKSEFKRIDKKVGALETALELDMEILMWADKNNLELLHDIFMVSALEALIQVAHKYKLPNELFIQERAKYKDIPNTIEECEALGGKSLLK